MGRFFIMEDMEKQKNNSMPIRVYKPSGWMQFGLGLMIVFIVIHFSIMMRMGLEAGWFFLILVPLYGLILWMLLISSTQQHLAIYENGLEYRVGNNRRFSIWEDMQRFEIRPQGKSSVIGIYTSHLEKRYEGSAVERLLLHGYKDFIPLTVVRVPTRWDGCWSGAVVDTVKFAETDFGRELLHYAPHLFDYSKEKQKHG
jgi:hypothetical protein